jgi:hypothetical protein
MKGQKFIRDFVIGSKAMRNVGTIIEQVPFFGFVFAFLNLACPFPTHNIYELMFEDDSRPELEARFTFMIGGISDNRAEFIPFIFKNVQPLLLDSMRIDWP